MITTNRTHKSDQPNEPHHMIPCAGLRGFVSTWTNSCLPLSEDAVESWASEGRVGISSMTGQAPAVSGRSKLSMNAISSTPRRVSLVGNGLAG